MALSTCPKSGCNSHFFEIVEHTPSDSRFKHNFVQCSSCGTVVGVLDFYNIGQLIYRLAAKLKIKLDS